MAIEDKPKNINQSSPTEDSSLESTPQVPPETDLTSSSGTSSSGSTPPPKRKFNLRRFFGRHNLYLLILGGLIILTMAATILTLKFGNNSNNKPSKGISLTDKQLAELKGATTVVGDAQQTLDVQSNSVFEGQVLLRNNLDVAGSIKVGGTLSLSSVAVSGTSVFGQVSVGGSLSVAGATTLQGTVNLQKNLAVSGSATFGGTVSAGKLSAGSLQITGDLTISRHIALAGGVPSRTNGSALGSGGTASVNGSDTGGTVTINTGGGPPAGCFVTVGFSQGYGSTPHVIISPSNSSAAGLNYYTNRSTASFSICTTSGPSASTTYLFDYFILD